MTSYYQRDTLIRYLLDELHTYEEDHSNALCPVHREEVSTVVMSQTRSEPASERPMTQAEGRELLLLQAESTKKMLQEYLPVRRALSSPVPIMPYPGAQALPCGQFPMGIPSAMALYPPMHN